MSHFSVMVVTDSEPSESMLEQLMQPYHEFECTGTDDKYVQSVDRTEEAKAKYESQAKDEPEPRENFRQWVVGWYGTPEVQHGATPDTQDKHKYGYVVIAADGSVAKVIDRTNPNKKWDYWRVGGRYRAKLQVKDGALTGVSTPPSWEWVHSERGIPDGFDSACVADIDFDKMKAVAVQARKDWVQECVTKCGLSREDFETGCAQQKESYAKWLELLPEERRPRGAAYRQWLRDTGYSLLADAMKDNWELPDTDGKPLDEWIDSTPPLTAFAVVKDGNWYEQGRMGWWAFVSDEDDQWDEKFNELVASLQPTQWITFLDCHI